MSTLYSLPALNSRKKIGNVLIVLTNKTAIVWSMCHVAKMAVSILTNNACRFSKLLKGQCVKNCKVKKPRKTHLDKFRAEHFNETTEIVCLFIRQAMLGELAFFLTEAWLNFSA